MNEAFSLAPTPQLHFGTGKVSIVPDIVKTFGSTAILVTGAKSFTSSSYYQKLLDQLYASGIHVEHCTVSAEPTPAIVDAVVKNFSGITSGVVVGIGGGSVLDAGKAISAMLPLNEPVKDYLESVGDKLAHPGVKIPFIAVPTTSGTGSEATKNAVLSEIGPNGYKKSLRHNNFIPNVAILDPALTVSCSPEVTAAGGMDAFTQLLESYLSTAANPFTDALAYEGLKRVSGALPIAYQEGTNVSARTDMALASYLSGITLANAGLGLVHGFAGSIGGFFPIAHGVICSALMGAVNRITVRKLRHEGTNDEALLKYALAGKIFANVENKSNAYYTDFLLNTIEAWTNEMNIPRLRLGGVRSTDFDRIVKATDNKNNPVNLNREEMMEILEMTS